MSVVTITRSGALATILVDNPPVNALGYAVRVGLIEALDELAADASVTAVVLRCQGRTFFAGADINEFGKPPREPSLRVVIARLDAFEKPVVAAVHGTALGGGFEVALGCTYRVAVASARFGLPEVKLGLLPGAGGTQRLPRVLGAAKAAELMVSGEMIDAATALAAGAIDEIVPDLDAAAAFAERVAAVRPLPRISAFDDKLADVRQNPALLDEIERGAAKKARGNPAVTEILRCVRDAATLPFAEGIAREAQGFQRLLTSPESAAQRYFFMAEREAGKVPDIGADIKTRPIRKAAVLGAGTMGGGIAMNFANAGIPVTIIETQQDALDRGLAIIRSNYERTAKRGGLTAEQVEQRVGLITGSLTQESVADVDIVTEAVFEDMALKKEIFANLDRIARPDAILASNTSTLDVDEIAAATKHPERVVGMHYFSPANVMKLVEVVRGKESAKEVVATAFELSRKLKKVPVQTGVCYGFIGNRMLHQRSSEVEFLLTEGASPAEVDKPLLDYGFPMGPCAMGDLAGLDVGYRIRKHLGIRSEISDRLVEAGRLGQKTGAGYFRYEKGDRTPLPDPAVDKIIDDVAREVGQNRRSFTGEEILDRLLLPMINEGAKILDEGIALRASDIDVVWVYGYGFPVMKGGPMFWADSVGLATIRDKLRAQYDQTGRESWKPAPLIERLAAAGKGFRDHAHG
jgi:3-hydroxyacyl-CoA dehydrogenase